MITRAGNVRVRQCESDELSLVIDAWVQGYTRSRSKEIRALGLPRWAWYRMLRAFVMQVLTGTRAVVHVLELEDTPGEVIAWTCAEAPTKDHPLSIHHSGCKLYVQDEATRAELIGAVESTVLALADHRGARRTFSEAYGC